MTDSPLDMFQEHSELDEIHLGQHVLAEFFECDPNTLNSIDKVEKYMIHTWPELGYAAVDLFTCGTKCDPKVAYEFLKKKFSSKRASFTELKRGIITRNTMKVVEKPFEIMQQIVN